jgi:hypothetical protein
MAEFDSSFSEFDDEVDRRDAGFPISLEPHTIPAEAPFRYKLVEVPDPDVSIQVTGTVSYTSVGYLPTQSGEYFVDYTLGTITHHQDNLGDAVLVSYTGLGTVADAADMNERTDAIERIEQVIGLEATLRKHYPNLTDRLNSTSGQLRAYADPSLDNAKGFRVTPGRFFKDDGYATAAGGKTIEMGPGYAFQSSALPANQYRRVIFGVNANSVVIKFEGTASSTEGAAQYPVVPSYSDVLPFAAVLVQDDGTGAAGTIKPITQYSIEDWRPHFLHPTFNKLTAMYSGDRKEYGRVVLTAGTTNTQITFGTPFSVVKSIQVTPEIQAGDENADLNLKIGYRTNAAVQVYSNTAPASDVEVNWSAVGHAQS